MKATRRIASLLVIGLVLSGWDASARGGATAPKPGLVGHYYGNPTFWYYGGTTTWPSLDADVDMGKLRWPPRNTKKPPRFVRDVGWSVALYGTLRVDKPGAYRFFHEGDLLELRLGGRRVPLDGARAVSLEQGGVPVVLYGKSASPRKDWTFSVHLKWQGPGMRRAEAIAAALLTHGEADAARTRVCDPQIVLRGGRTPFVGMREFDVTIPHDGFYELVGHLQRMVNVEMRLDGRVVYHHQNRGKGYPIGFANTVRAVRYLSKGTHTVRLALHGEGYPWEDMAKLPWEDRPWAWEESRFGLNRIPRAEPGRTFTVIEKGRDDMVLRRGEPLVIRIERATRQAQAYTVEVRSQRGRPEPVWAQRVNLPANRARAVAEAAYPCDREGAFEYQVKDAAGHVVEGPWAFVVVDPTPLPVPQPTVSHKEVLVDRVDCTREADPEHHFRDNGTSRVIEGPSGRYRVTGRFYGPMRDYALVKGKWRIAREGDKVRARFHVHDWFAYTLRVKHPGRTHVVVAHIPTDARRLVQVQGFDHVTGNYNGALLDCGDNPASEKFAKLAFLMWPNTTAIDVATMCVDHPRMRKSTQGAIARIELYELSNGLAPLARAARGWSGGKEFGWQGEQVNLGIEQRTMPPLWAGNELIPGAVPRFDWHGGYHDWKALCLAWQRFGELARWRGDNFLSWPVYTYGTATLPPTNRLPRYRDVYGGGYKARAVDRLPRDILKMMLLVCRKYGVTLIADFMHQRITAAHILTAERAGTPSDDGLWVSDIQGKRVNYPAAILNPAHPLVRRYLVALVGEVAERYGRYAAFGGIRIRQGPWWGNDASCYPSIDHGNDDFTIGLFEKETGVRVPVTEKGMKRFAMRRDWLAKHAHEKWLTWRCDKVVSLRRAMLAALRKHAPHARLDVWRRDNLGRERGLDPAVLARDRDLGFGRAKTFGGRNVEINFLDPVAFRNFDIRQPESLRLRLETMPHRVTVHQQARTYPQGMCSGVSFRAHPYQMEAPAKVLAEGPIDAIVYGGAWTLPNVDPGLREWTRAWRAIPDLDYQRVVAPGRADEPVVCWSAKRGKDTVFYLVNRTPRTRRATVTTDKGVSAVTDLVSGRRVGGAGTRDVTVGPFMLRVFCARGGGVMGVAAAPEPDRVRNLERRLAHLRRLAARAAGVVHVCPHKGERYTATSGVGAMYDFDLAHLDLRVCAKDLLDPVAEAWGRGDYTGVAERLEDILAEHAWWHQAFGWPPGVYRYELPCGRFADARKLIGAARSAGPLVLDTRDDVPGEVLVVPSGKVALPVEMDVAGRVEMRAWIVSGKGHGPVTVRVDGKPAGTLGTGDGPARFAHFTTVKPLGLLSGTRTVVLEGPRGTPLVIQGLEAKRLAPDPIRKWHVIGLFDKGGREWDGFDKVFPPENTVDLGAVYDGLGGAKARWQRIDIGREKIVQLLEKHYPYPGYKKMNAVAYLVCWVHSPTERDVTLYYAIDWFVRAWINDTVVIEKAAGPWHNFAEKKVTLRKGWNRLLVKSVSGTGNWLVSFALSDPGDLRYSPDPPPRHGD